MHTTQKNRMRRDVGGDEGRRAPRFKSAIQRTLASAGLLLALGAALLALATAPRAASTGDIEGTVRDAAGVAIIGAQIVVEGGPWAAATARDGSFALRGLPPGRYLLRVRSDGYLDVTEGPVDLREGQILKVSIRLQRAGATVAPSGQAEPPQAQPSEADRLKAESRNEREQRQGGEGEGLWGHFKSLVPGVAMDRAQERGASGGRLEPPTNDSPWGVPKPMPLGVQRAPVQPPVYPYTGGTRLPNDEPFDSMFFKHYGVNPFIPADEDALSTFAVDVDAASYTVARRYLELGQLPPPESVRVEEFVNFLHQDYPTFDDVDFRVLMDGAPSPYGQGYHLLRVGLKGREVSDWRRQPAGLTFVIDISGSMARENRLELVKQALRLLVDRLRPEDRVGIVVFGTQGRVLLEPTSLGHAGDEIWPAQADRSCPDPRGGRERILWAIDRLSPEGSTNAEEGLRLGYDMARRQYRGGAINRILLCSDGVANVGLTGAESILAHVRREADSGIHLTTIGFGMGNFNDVLLEKLADQGDGNYYYVDDLGEARRVFEENLTGTLQTIAKDAKVQVEFDPGRVLRYRLIGFENRDVADRDFRNDRVDAGEIGAGHEVTALYEVKLASGVRRGRIATVRLRYATAGGEGRTEGWTHPGKDVREIESSFDAADLRRSFDDAAPRFRLDAAVAEFAEILRGSYWARGSRIEDVLPVARRAAGELRGDEAVTEFLRLAERTAGFSEELSQLQRRVCGGGDGDPYGERLLPAPRR